MTFYQERLDALGDTLRHGRNLDVAPFAEALRASGDLPVVVVGSGGSLITASVLAREMVKLNDVPVRAATPLDVIADPLTLRGCSVWLVSAEGTNPDILAALEAVSRAEPRRLSIICNRLSCPLVELAALLGLPVFVFATEGQKDGFLATHTLMLSAAAIVRATRDVPGRVPSQPPAAAIALSTEGVSVFERETLFILYDPLLADAAHLLETNLWEAAVSNVEAVDLRNFAHGRHLWAAKRAETLGVLVLTTGLAEPLWRELDRELPLAIPRHAVVLDEGDPGIAIAGLWTAMLATAIAGAVRGVDPGRPGVPDFGRRIYHSPALLMVADTARSLTPVDRKLAGRRDGELVRAEWSEAEQFVRKTLSTTDYGALILDYDGTLVATQSRRNPPSARIVARLVELICSGVRIGIATGRGDSVGVALRACLPEPLWPRVTVGYYNGGLVAQLDDEIDREILDFAPELAVLAVRLAERCRGGTLQIRDQRVQLCITSFELSVRRVRDLVLEVAADASIRDVSVVMSGHSVDVLAPGVDKRNVLSAIEVAHDGTLDSLRIGDSGDFPGNDHALLRSPHGLSVDRVSGDPLTCWNLLPAGLRGPAGLIAYLDRLIPRAGGFGMDVMTL